MDRKIDVMIVGAQKAGTTSLLRYLGEHPDCISHAQKEFTYFTDPVEYEDGPDIAYKKYFSHASYKGKKVISKNAGLFTNEDGLKRLRSNNPDCTIVIILRNPVERTYSSFLMEKNAGATFEFSELPDLMKVNLGKGNKWEYEFMIDFSLYVKHLKKLYQYFAKEQIRIVLFDELKQEPLRICKEIFEKIGVDPSFNPNVEVKHNTTQKARSSTYAKVLKKLLNNENPLKKTIKKVIPGNKVSKYGELLRDVNVKSGTHQPMDEEIRKYFVDFFKPHNKELEQLIGIDLSKWDI